MATSVQLHCWTWTFVCEGHRGVVRFFSVENKAYSRREFAEGLWAVKRIDIYLDVMQYPIVKEYNLDMCPWDFSIADGVGRFGTADSLKITCWIPDNAFHNGTKMSMLPYYKRSGEQEKLKLTSMVCSQSVLGTWATVSSSPVYVVCHVCPEEMLSHRLLYFCFSRMYSPFQMMWEVKYTGLNWVLEVFLQFIIPWWY